MKIRILICLVKFLAFASALLAKQQTFIVTPSSLAGWTLVGEDTQTLSGQAELVLPADTQLVRSVTGNEVALQIVTQPVIGENSREWPVLELGGAALVFSRSGTLGKLVLVVGDQTPKELPLSFALDAKGRSAEALSIGFSRDGTVVSLSIANQKLQFPAGRSIEQSLEIVASAGETEPWSFERLDVTVSSPDPIPPPPASRVTTASVSGSSSMIIIPASPALAKPAKTMTPAEWIAANRAADKVRDPRALSPAVTADDLTALEIFTPPVVRRVRTAVVRAAVQNQSGN